MTWAVHHGFEFVTDPELIFSLPDTVRAWKETRLQWEPKAAVPERLPGDLYASLRNLIPFLPVAHNLKWSSGSNAAIRTLCPQILQQEVMLSSKPVKQAVVSPIGQGNITTWRRIKKACHGLLHFWQTRSGQKWSPQAQQAKGNWQSVHSLLQSTLKSK